MKKLFYFIFPVLLFLVSCDKESDESNNTGNFTDSRDGQAYTWVKIGNQTWMSQNLNFSVSDLSIVYPGQENSKNGKLYKWSALKDIAPSGWHIPSKSEWSQLIDYLGGDKVAGDKMKLGNEWEGTVNGNNSSGFSALPVSMENGTLVEGVYPGLYADFWSNSADNELNAFGITLNYGSPITGIYSTSKERYMCIRCIKNE